ncbi:MAG: S46 family peptidase, partial [Ignavibacteriaceae bacterium]|nr:S46 family peptidase [Ignavibacteriaceae bacterium]
GMYPLSEIRKLDLKKAGLKIDIDEVYNPNGISLIDALVNVGGCTGSFVSDEGLIITNHHCSFGAVTRASTTENNYLENGFIAKKREEEIPAQGMICRITVGYEDVSEQVLQAANESDDVSKRTEAIRNKVKEIKKAAEEKEPGIEAEVSEMFTGQTYILFKYQVIKDVRLVYVPPRNIGEFGGESDNWVWPRHTGDFSFIRAYVAADGSPAAFSKENVPFKPKRFLKVNANGVDDGDFVFILGYPGRTFRHQPSQFMVMQQEYQLPYIQDLYSWGINLLEERGANDPEFALKFASRVKGFANTEKNYRGKLKGLHRLNLVEKKQNEEKELQRFIESDPLLKEKYGDVLGKIENVYKEIFELGRVPLFLSQITRHASSMRFAALFNDYREQLEKTEAERMSIFKKDGREDLMKQIDEVYSFYEPELDKKIIKKMLTDFVSFPEGKKSAVIQNYLSDKTTKEKIEEFVDDMISNSVISNAENYKALFDKSAEELKEFDDPLFQFVSKINEEKKELEEQGKMREGELNILLSEFMDAKKVWLNKAFVPDANGTLRLTYGYVRGYAPADA